MILSDLSIKRPVMASVISLLLIVFGVVAFNKLPLREYPDIDSPVVSVETTYPGASARIVETRITELIEDRVAGVEGIKNISSTSKDGESDISIEFKVAQDINEAANDVRDRVSRIADNLPEEADPPEVQKTNSNEDVIAWLNLSSPKMTVPEITDYADRYLLDRFSVLPGVARVRIGGGQKYAMRIWLDRNKLAARNLTSNDVEKALREENVELPAGSIESLNMQFTARVERAFKQPSDFAKLVLAEGEGGYLIRLGDVARVEKSSVEDRTFFRGNKEPMVGIGIIKQSTANTIEVAGAAVKLGQQLNSELPPGMRLHQSYDESVFVKSAINEVYKTLAIAVCLVVLVIFIFLGSFRAMLIPALTVPISIIAAFIILWWLGFSVNLLTLLALVMAIGLVVDDAIVVLENVVRRIKEKREPKLLAAYRGSRQVAFAVIATTLVLLAVFVPIAFLEGDLGQLFSEFALTMAAAVAFSSFVALSLSPMLASKVLSANVTSNRFLKLVDRLFNRLRKFYAGVIKSLLPRFYIVLVIYALIVLAAYYLFTNIQTEYTPKEDRGAFFIMVKGPEGASFKYMEQYMNKIENRLIKYVETKEINRLLVRAPRGFGNIESFNSGMVIAIMNDWANRRSAFTVIAEIRKKLSDLPGVKAFPIMRQGFGRSRSKPVQFVLGGGTFEELTKWRDILLAKINNNNPGFIGLDSDYNETKPQLEIEIDYERAAELGVTVSNIGRTLETMLGSRRVKTFLESGKEYDVILEGERESQRTVNDIQNIYVRSARTQKLIPLSNLVHIAERADAISLNRYNRVRAITLEANLKDGFTLGQALTYLENLAREHLPAHALTDFKGQSQDFKDTGASILFVFILGILVTFLVLAAQFESWIHPLVIIVTVPLALVGGLFGIYLTGSTLNIYSEIGLIMLIGLAAKNGILIVEFINQLRDEGMDFTEAIIKASSIRLRPILMTSITTTAGAVPLLIASGAGAETRIVIGTVIFSGVTVATIFTIFVVPVFYYMLARKTGSPKMVSKKLELEIKLNKA